MAEDELDDWQCWQLLRGLASSPVATLDLLFEGTEAEARDAQDRVEEGAVTFVTRAVDLERVYQSVFELHPTLQRIYASRYRWNRA